MARRVLVPLDGSPAAEAAVWHAAAVAPALADGLLLLQVLEPGSAFDTADGDVDWRLRRAESGAYLRSVAERLAALGIDAATEVAMGAAADEIVRYARRDDVALIALAAHGRGEAEAFEFGGTCHKVLSCAPASIMVVRRSATAAPAVGYRHVLVPVDGSPAGEWALGLAATIAQQHGATLVVLHLVHGIAPSYERLPRTAEETELLERLEALQRARGERYLADMATRLAHAGLTIHTHLVRAARVADAIQDVAADQRVDLIALSAHGAGGAATPYGGVAQRLLASVGPPVLVFQDLRRVERAADAGEAAVEPDAVTGEGAATPDADAATPHDGP